MSYSFLRESKLYIVYGGNKYRIYTSSAITFNQTFAEDSYSVKTLHDQSKMFENSSITKANPASFNFDVPLTLEKEESIVIDLISDLVAKTGDPDSSASDRHDHDDTVIAPKQLKSFDIYVQTGSTTFKLESAIITSANFDFIPGNQFTVRIEGQGTKLSRAGDESFTIPGSAVSGSFWGDTTKPYHQLGSRTRTPLIVYPVITIDSLNMTSIVSVNLQLQNSVNWSPFETLHDSLSVTNSSNAMFPTTYTLDKRTISGEVRQYQTDNNITQFDDFSTNSDMILKAVQVGKAHDATPFFQIQLNPVMYTARMDPGDVYTQSYDYRSLQNTAVSTQITQYS